MVSWRGSGKSELTEVQTEQRIEKFKKSKASNPQVKDKGNLTRITLAAKTVGILERQEPYRYQRNSVNCNLCVRVGSRKSELTGGTDIKEMDKIKDKMDKTGHEKEKSMKSRGQDVHLS
ncbi:hypothetical protein Tco_0963009 [Tanacetum coccineum]